MFFILLCILIGLFLITDHPPDEYGWMMLVGLGWIAGYLDGRIFAKSDRDKERTIPPDVNERGDDSAFFQE